MDGSHEMNELIPVPVDDDWRPAQCPGALGDEETICRCLPVRSVAPASGWHPVIRSSNRLAWTVCLNEVSRRRVVLPPCHIAGKKLLVSSSKTSIRSLVAHK